MIHYATTYHANNTGTTKHYIESSEYTSSIRIIERQGHVGRESYLIEVPALRLLSNDELLTRCDNNELSLNEPVGQKHHFGGTVTLITSGVYRVEVYTD